MNKEFLQTIVAELSASIPKTLKEGIPIIGYSPVGVSVRVPGCILCFENQESIHYILPQTPNGPKPTARILRKRNAKGAYIV